MSKASNAKASRANNTKPSAALPAKSFHNLGTVFQFEVTRTLKKKSFWVMALAFPVLIGAIFAIAYFSGKASDTAADNTKNQSFSIGVTDLSGTIRPELLKAYKAQTITDKATGIALVTDQKLDAYFYFPANLASQKVEIYATDVGLFDNSRYEAVAKALLTTSASESVNPQIAAVLQDVVTYTSTTYKDGKVFDGFGQLVAPGLFLVLFYLVIAFFGNQMLTSTTEEKENRVIEMILTTIQARTLIIGKILALVVLAAVQLLLILVPIVLAYIFARAQLSLPEIDLSTIVFNPARIALAAGIFISGFLLFTGILTGIGAAAPTAKDAGGFIGVVMVLLFGPLYAVSLFVSTPDAPIVTFLTYFPLTAPIPLLLRNAVGNIDYLPALLGIVILSVSAVIALSIAIRTFRFGALEYSRRVSLRDIFRRAS